jgi:hypothetical protein
MKRRPLGERNISQKHGIMGTRVGITSQQVEKYYWYVVFGDFCLDFIC